MKILWDYYENYDEYVYASDVDTYELVYMNKKTREAFNVDSLQSLAGKTCYETLQLCSSPCTLCNSSKLEPGMFTRGYNFNPILEQYISTVDTMILDNGRRYRIQIAHSVMDDESKISLISKYKDMGGLINNALAMAFQKISPDETIQCLLEHLGQILKGERAYIFEKDEHNRDFNTHEWVAAGVTPEKEHLQDLDPSVCEPWYEQFKTHDYVRIRNLEDIRETTPVMYSVLEPQDIRSLVVIPLRHDGKTIGFCGIDNLPDGTAEFAVGVLRIMAYFIVTELQRRDLVRSLNEMSYLDQQTGLGNRHAYQRHIDENLSDDSLGVVFCDITGLKRINDQLGHSHGDRMILRAAESIKNVFEDYSLFRFGGDELVALCPAIDKEELEKKAKLLKTDALSRDVNLAIGTAWAPAGCVNVDRLMSDSETDMYRDKAEYYATSGLDRRRE